MWNSGAATSSDKEEPGQVASVTPGFLPLPGPLGAAGRGGSPAGVTELESSASPSDSLLFVPFHGFGNCSDVEGMRSGQLSWRAGWAQ